MEFPKNFTVVGFPSAFPDPSDYNELLDLKYGCQLAKFFVCYKVLKWWRHKKLFFEIMGFTEIFWKYMMKSTYLQKINILLQFGDKILTLSRSSNSIQILVILSSF